jgi:hypothetical protein
MFTVRDLITRYGVHEDTVLHWIRTGQLKAINVGQSPGAKKPRWRVPQAAVEAFEAARTRVPAEPMRSANRKANRVGDVVEFYK